MSIAEAMRSAPNAYIPVPMRIGRAIRDIDGVFTWTLEPSEPFAFASGQFNMLYAHGVGEVPISISGDPNNSSILRHTIRVVGTVTQALDALDVGDEVGVRGPFGSAWPLAEASGQDVLFVAGGLGLAPLRPAILSVLARRGEFGQVSIIYGARSPADILFRDELEQWRGRFDVTLDAIVDHSGTDWYGRVGVVTRLVAEADIDPECCVAMLCGPEIMMRFTARELEQRGFEQSQIWVSLERSMKCAVGLCGHCQLGGTFVCKDGPVYRYDRVASMMLVRGL
jgi:NAD(P)H-flavin reductase